jgi:homoserine dehydrogenase
LNPQSICNPQSIRNPQSAMTTFDLLLVGYGNVAKRFVTLLKEQRARLARRYGIRARVIGIATRRDGPRYVVSGFSRTVVPPGSPKGKHDIRAATRRIAAMSTLEFIRDATKRSATAARERRLVVVETTTLDIERGEPATSHIRAALSGGAHVVTANKGPVAFAYRLLARAAERANRRFLFEGAVMDGVPVFNLVRETLPAVTIIGFRGVLNSTTNYILTAMEQGQPFGEALAEMQAMGVAEADASLDVDGWDAAAKTAALANVLLGAAITPATMERRGITPETGRAAIDARTRGQRVKLVARAGWERNRVTARVAPETLADDDLLAMLEGQQNAIILQTDLLDEIAVVQRSGGLTQTAYALLSDLMTIVRDVKGAPAIRRSRRSTRPRRSPSRRARRSR